MESRVAFLKLGGYNPGTSKDIGDMSGSSLGGPLVSGLAVTDA